jgi:hypothetical protein
MSFMLAISLWLYVRPGGATRGKWRIWDGKGESGLFSCSDLRRWWPPPVLIEDWSSGPNEQD